MPNDKSGFTLIELVVAIVIFAIGITGIFAMQGIAVKTNAYSMNFARATSLLENSVEYLRSLDFDDPMLNAKVDQVFTLDYKPINEVAGRLGQARLTVVDSAANLKTITVDVDWRDDTNHTISMTFIKRNEPN